MEQIETVTAPPVTVWLAQPGGRSDEAIEPLTELGVARIGAMRCRMLKGAFTDARLERWRRGRSDSTRSTVRSLASSVSSRTISGPG